MTGKPKSDNPEQHKRFVEAARSIGAEGADVDAFDRLLESVARSKRPKPEPKIRRPRKPKASSS